MRYTALIVGFLVLFTPSLAFSQAQAPRCSEKGYTVIFINGIFGDKIKAESDKEQLKRYLTSSFNNEPITVQVGYNPSHLAGLSDVIQTASQLFGDPVSDFDLKTILLQIYPEVTTRKLILVGHSQGSLYSNEVYNYLLAHGEPKDAVDVYNVASVADTTVGSGKYLNSSTDSLLNNLRSLHFKLLPNNIDLDVTGVAESIWKGHGFSNTYLAQAADRIVGDIDTEMSALKPTYATNTGDCFTPPVIDTKYKTEQVLFTVGDPTATAFKVTGAGVIEVGAIALNTTKMLAIGLVQLVADSIKLGVAPPSDAQATAKTNTVVNKLYGSSLNGLSAEDRKELLGDSQGGAVALAVPKTSAPAGVVLGTSTELATTSTPMPPANIFPSSSNGPVYGGGAGSSPTVAVESETAAAVFDDTVSSTSDSDTPAQDDNASSTPPVVDEASSTPPTPPAPAAPTGAPIVDSFDSYSADPALSAWSTWPPYSSYNYYARFKADTGNADPFLPAISGDNAGFVDRVYTGTTDCYSGNCIYPDLDGGGFGGGGHSSIMFKESGIGQDAGAFTIWARTRAGWRLASANVGLCLGISLGCINPNAFWVDTLGTADDQWHKYYIAWRQGATNIETCTLQDDTNGANCTWKQTIVPTGTQVDGILLGAGAVRQDLGDQVWFDDIAEAPAQ